MVTLFALVVMRISGAIAGNPVFGRTNFPARARACMIVALSVLLYQSTDGTFYRTPGSMVEYMVMLLGELLFGLVISFAMELSFMVVRFASSVMDYCMGLSMAQIYDPQYGTQSTVSSGALLRIYGIGIFCHQWSFASDQYFLYLSGNDPFWNGNPESQDHDGSGRCVLPGNRNGNAVCLSADCHGTAVRGSYGDSHAGGSAD